MQFGEVFYWFTRKNNKNQIWFEIHFKFSYYFSNYCVITFFNFSTYILKVSGEEPKPKSTYAEYVRATKYILALCLKHFQEKIFNIFEKSVKRCHKNATHGMVSWRSSATVYIHINTNSIWTIRKRSVLEFLKRKYILDLKKKFYRTKGTYMGFKADVKWPPFFISTQNFHLMLLLRNFENSSNTAKNSQKKRIEEKPYSTCLLT